MNDNSEVSKLIQTNAQIISMLRSNQSLATRVIPHLMKMAGELKRLNEEVEALKATSNK